MQFDGRKIRDEILAELKVKVSKLKTKPTLAVIWVGEDPISARYVEQKQRAAEFLGVHFDIFKFPADVSEQKLIEKIIELNKSAEISGILVQIPLPETINHQKITKVILPEKDVDGLRFCAGLDSEFQPPVVLAILQALNGIDLEQKKVIIIGQGFLVGAPLKKSLKNKVEELRVADINTSDLSVMTKDADIVISATGKSGLITAEMVKEGAVLIDVGIAEVNGRIAGDIDPAAYKKSAFYTPVPGGIGPVTVAMLYSNLVATATKFKS